LLAKVVLIAIGGAAGTLARYWLGGLAQRLTGGLFPWGTFTVNMLGCFLFGLVWALAEERFLLSSETRVVVLVGFMGAFTTFSTFVFESGSFMRDSQWALVIGNIAAQNVVGLVCLFLGLFVARLV